MAEPSVLPWFLGIAALGILTGGALTASEALVAEESYQTHKGRQGAPQRARSTKPATRIRTHVEAALRPVTAPGSVSPKPAPVAVQRSSPTAPPGAVDERLYGILVGMGFKAAEANGAIGKLPPSTAKVALGDQVKAALALLAK